MPKKGSTPRSSGSLGIKDVPRPLSVHGKPSIRRAKRRTSSKDDPKLTPLLPLTPPVPSTSDAFLERYESWGGLSRGTFPEFIVWEWLTYHKHQVEGLDFLFQSSQFGGRRVLGGAVVDFFILRQNAIWRVQGERFHLRQTEDRTFDILQKIKLVSNGYLVIDIWADDLLTRSEFVLNLAWDGRQVDTYGLHNL